MFKLFKFILSWKLILLAIATFFIGDQVNDILNQAEAEALLEETKLKDDIDAFDIDDVDGIMSKVRIVADSIKEKISSLLDQYKDRVDN